MCVSLSLPFFFVPHTLPSSLEHPLVTSPAHPTNPLCLITERNLMTNSNYALMLPFMGFSIQTLSFFMLLLIQTTLDIIKNSKRGQLKERSNSRKFPLTSNAVDHLTYTSRVCHLTYISLVLELISHERF